MKKKYMALLMVAAMAALTGCGGSGGAATESTASTVSVAESTAEESEMEKPAAVEKTDEDLAEAGTAIENPFIDCKTLEIAQRAVGFEMTLPSLPDGYEVTNYRAMGEEMLEVIATDGSEHEIRLRKAKGLDDVSGDYNSYDSTEEVSVGDLTVTEKSNSDSVHVATWISGDYSYAIDADQGIDAETIAVMVQAMA